MGCLPHPAFEWGVESSALLPPSLERKKPGNVARLDFHENKSFNTFVYLVRRCRQALNLHTRNTAFHTINAVTIPHPRFPASHQNW